MSIKRLYSEFILGNIITNVGKIIYKKSKMIYLFRILFMKGGIMKLIKKYLYIIFILFFIILFIYFMYVRYKLQTSSVVPDDIIVEKIAEEDDSLDDELYTIDIKGAVKLPGVYRVPRSYVINDVISEAGGLTKDADTSLINLSKKISNEMVIIIYTKDEVKKSNIKDTVIKVVEKECVCPNIQNDGCINNEIDDTISNNGGLININIASEEELMTIPGIGSSKAKAIIEYRKNNRFNSIEDIMNVTGIGNSLYETIKIYITT